MKLPENYSIIDDYNKRRGNLMEKRQLGKNGPRIPVIGLGAWPIGGGMGAVDEKNAIKTIHAAIDNGILLLDTAQGYRNSESIIGKALKNGYRNRCFLATKVTSKYSPRDIHAAMANSLQALAVDYVDLYQIHTWKPEYPIEQSMEALVQLQNENKTRYIGVSNFNAEQMAQAKKTAPFSSNQPAYSLFDRHIEPEDILFCRKEGIGILAHSPLAKGLLTGKYQPNHKFDPDDERSNMPRFQGKTFENHLMCAQKLELFCLDKNISLPQLAVSWALRLQEVTCVLVGAKTPAQIEEFIKADEIKYTEEELAVIEKILRNAD